MSNARIHHVETPVGVARWHRYAPERRAVGRLVLGHGAGGRSWSADLLALTELTADGWEVILVEQPWRVAGKSVAVAPPRLDEAWVAVLADIARPTQRPRRSGDRARTERAADTVPLVVGGRSAGARVACRTAHEVGASGVLALAFPLHPPGKPETSRIAELLAAADLPTLVVQGERDPFGTPSEIEQSYAAASSAARPASSAGPVAQPGPRVVAVPGAHAFAPGAPGVAAAVRPWLADLRSHDDGPAE